MRSPGTVRFLGLGTREYSFVHYLSSRKVLSPLNSNGALAVGLLPHRQAVVGSIFILVDPHVGESRFSSSSFSDVISYLSYTEYYARDR